MEFEGSRFTSNRDLTEFDDTVAYGINASGSITGAYDDPNLGFVRAADDRHAAARDSCAALEKLRLRTGRGARDRKDVSKRRSEVLRFKSTKTNNSRAILLPAFMIERTRKVKVAQAEALLRVRIRQNGETLVCCQANRARATQLPLTPPRAKFRWSTICRMCAFTICVTCDAAIARGRASEGGPGTAGTLDRHDNARPLQPRHHDHATGCGGPSRRRARACYKRPARLEVTRFGSERKF